MKPNNITSIIVGCIGLTVVYVFQDQLFYNPFNNFIYDPIEQNFPDIINWKYILSKSFRFILNDGFAILIIYGLFGSGKYVKFAAFVFLFGFLILLPAYLVLSLNFYNESYAYLNHLHRLVLNPVLMMLLIPAFYAQKKRNE